MGKQGYTPFNFFSMNTDHVIIRNESLFCSHCGRKQGVSYPIEINVFAAMCKAFSKSHAACEKTWQEPTPDEKATEFENKKKWLKQGEHGISSKTIYSVLSGQPLLSPSRYSHPLDPDDFRRCYLLLKFVPSWRARISEMSIVSPVWAALAENWDKLSDMIEAGMKKGKAPEMYDFMQSLGC